MEKAEHDVVVAGAGHNSLVAAAYLAKAGFTCLVLEHREIVGGNTVTEELTLPGFLHDRCASAHNIIQASPMLRDDELGLSRYGLEYILPDPVVFMPFPDGRSITQWLDLDRTCAELAPFSRRDAAAYRRLIDDYAEVAAIFNDAAYTPIGFGPSLPERLAAHPSGKTWQRRIALSAWDVIRHRFESEHIRAFMLWMAFMTMVPPDQPMSGRLAFSLVAGRQRWSWAVPKGGSSALPNALARLIADHGGALMTGKTVDGLIVEDGKCCGVTCVDGTRYRARKAVLSTVHVKHLIPMAPAEVWGADFVEAVETWQTGTGMFAAHYATTEPLVADGPDGPLTPSAVGIMPSVQHALRIGYDMARGVAQTDEPPLLAIVTSVADASRAPAGRHTLKIVGFHPYELREGARRWDAIKDDVARANLVHLRRYFPALTDDKVLAGVVHSPLDLERANPHNWHGSCHGGAQIPAQAAGLRPAPGWAQHRMPIPGLYQTGATTHPGGSVSGAPGRNAAMVMLKDFGTSLEAAIGRRDAFRV
ncbi:MAG TPA: NAD(P)/FAD-dependent oxidoreductase [Propylenella sp.]